jgi:L-iditol 2-dehydrogenase
MRSARWTGSGVEVVEVEPGARPEGWVRLEVTGCGICGSDLQLYRGMRDGSLSPQAFPTPGHEMAGRILEGPAGMADVIYAVEPWVACRGCPECQRGSTNICETGQLLGFTATGGLADYVDVPPHLLHPVPDSIGGRLASLAEPWAVAVRSVHRAQLTEVDERLLVLGGGTIGLLCGLAARDRVARVGITCRYPHQADLARRFGLEPIAPDELATWAAEHRPGVAIETVGGAADTMSDAVTHTRRGGRVVVVGVFAVPRPTDWVEVVAKELEIVGSFIYGTVRRGSEFGAAVGRMAPLAAELGALQTHHFPLMAATEAFATADDKASLAVKVTIGVN